ncbi:hypothetical protein [Bradyrhizobium sp.]|uniref:hypothetical protein n=1 Tax=Bradyrhizobium sp. TaxID=376 RepID=UPI003C5576BD
MRIIRRHQPQHRSEIYFAFQISFALIRILSGQMSLALSPPVTSYSARVIMLAASTARKTAAREMSSGCS